MSVRRCWAAVLLLAALALAPASIHAGAPLLQDDGQVADAVDAPPQPADPSAADPFAAQFELVSDELLVKFKPGATEEKKGKALAKGKAAERSVVRPGKGPDRLVDEGDLSLVQVADLPGRALLRAAAKKIQADEDVEYVEPNYIYRTQGVPTDPGLNNLWGMRGANAGANAEGAWNAGHTNCSGIVVGVVDTGIQIAHPDLIGSIWSNPGETVNGQDDDANNRIDDINGWDFFANDASVYDGTADSHGTHVCGTIGAVANSIGVVGVCPSGVKVIPTKFLGATGGSTAGAIAALDYLLKLKTKYNLNMVATSNSWGGGGFSSSLEAIIKSHNEAGILFIAAAGNAGANNDVTATYPCNYNLPNVICVGSIDSNGARSSFSNYGVTKVHMFAPGRGILSTVPSNAYAYYDGTSMATPHVSGAAALFAAAYKQAHGSLPTAALVKSRLMQTGTSDPSYNYQNLVISGTRLNVANLLNSVSAPEPDLTQIHLLKPSVTVYWANKKKTSVLCRVTLTVTNAYGAPIPNVSLQGEFTLEPDTTCTDPTSAWPRRISGTFSATSVSTDSPAFPYRASCGSTYQGARCVFTITAVSAPNYKCEAATCTNNFGPVASGYY